MLETQLQEFELCNNFQNDCAAVFDSNLNNWLKHVSTNLQFDYTSNCQNEIVAIDVGHAPNRHGVTSSQGKKEYDYNFNLAQTLNAELKRRGIQSVVLSYNVESGSFKQRKQAVRAVNATLFLSIHHDSVQSHYLNEWYVQGTKQRYSDRFSGFSLFVSAKSSTYEENKALAYAIGSQLVNVSQPTHHHAEPIEGENRPLLYPRIGVYRFDNLGVLRGNTIPSVLVEAGVLVNRREERQLADPLYQIFLASNIADGINNFCQ